MLLVSFLEQLKRNIRKIYLWVYGSNMKAIRFYTKHGFKQTKNTFENHHDTDENLLKFELPLYYPSIGIL